MNNIFILKNELTGEDPSFPTQEIKFTKNDCLDVAHVDGLISNVCLLKTFWENNQEYIDGSIIQVDYYNLVPKTKRVSKLFQTTGFKDNIIGAKYSYYNDNIGLSIIYKSNKLDDFDLLLNIFSKVRKYIEDEFDGSIRYDIFNKKFNEIRPLLSLSKNDFVKLLLEISRIRTITYPKEKFKPKDEQIVKFYVDPFSLKKHLDIHVLKTSIYDGVALLKKRDIENNGPLHGTPICPTRHADFRRTPQT